MSVPEPRSRKAGQEGRVWPRLVRSRGLLLAMLAAATGRSALAAGKPPVPSIRIPLRSVGMPVLSESFRLAGISAQTVHFLDPTHLLVTFGQRALVPRLAGDPEDDDDRLVAAEVVSLPAGKVEAKTVWHMHDHGRYLWSLGGGRFLVRIGDRLYTCEPLANLRRENPFARTVFPSRPTRLPAVFVSPDGAFVTTELAVRAHGETGETGEEEKRVTEFQFFRLHGEGSSGSPLGVEQAGNVLSPEPFVLPIDADGYLWAEEDAHNRWGISFNGFAEKLRPLGSIESSCVPRLQMVSRSEYLALSCRGSDDRVRLAAFGLDGHETWQEDLDAGSHLAFAYAPAAGRFAISRQVVPVSSANPSMPVPEDRQQVRVYDNVSGDLLLQVDCRPALKLAENFDLAADGLSAVVIRSGALEVYRLPTLAAAEKRDLAESARMAPPAGSGPVVLTRLLEATGPVARNPNEASVRPAASPRIPLGKRPPAPDTAPPAATSSAIPATSSATPATPSATSGAAGPATPAHPPNPAAAGESRTSDSQTAPAPARALLQNGDAQSGARRRPPTLMNPGEKPEIGPANSPAPADAPAAPGTTDPQ